MLLPVLRKPADAGHIGRHGLLAPHVHQGIDTLGRLDVESLELDHHVELGSLLADIGRQAKLTDEEFAVFEQVRDKPPARPMRFE
jgi:hypothetical protein